MVDQSLELSLVLLLLAPLLVRFALLLATFVFHPLALGRGVTFPLLALGLGALALGCGIALPRQALILGVAVLLGDLAHPRGNDHLRLRHGE